MKAKSIEKLKAIKLRKQGLSYREIQKIIPVSQASLSLWLKDIVLTEEQKNRLAELSLIGQVAGAKAKRQQRLNKLAMLSQEVKLEFPELIQDPFFNMGLALYWAEGAKPKPWQVSCGVRFSNSDELLILLMKEWFKKYCKSDEADFSYRLHIHISADVGKAKYKWAEILEIDASKISVTLKKHTSKFRHVNSKYKGLINLNVCKSTWLNRRIELWGQEAAKHFLN